MEISGHKGHYAAHMFRVARNSSDFHEISLILKPMNCPGSVLTYKRTPHTLSTPLKLAELGIVHRRESSGQLHGLLRVREFTQDDAHIFCRPEHIAQVIKEIMTLIDRTYALFNLTYTLELSTRPDDSIGTDEIWEKAENGLKAALMGKEYTINAGDGAFYGPKIDFHVRDRMGRTWQCGTIQLDFNMPERFELEYIDGDERKRPVMIHRVIFGSVERFLGILIEHFGGSFPLWLAPTQIVLLPLTSEFIDDALRIKERMRGLRVEVDSRNETLQKRIKMNALRKIPYTVTIGRREVETNSLSIRTFGSNQTLQMNIDTFISRVHEKVLRSDLNFNLILT